jgi:hypothetical protein
MSSNGNTIFQKANIAGKGRHHGSKNKAQLEIQRIGEANALFLLEHQIKLGLSGDEEAQRFLLNKFIPNAKPCRYIEIEDLPLIQKVEDILPTQNKIMSKIYDGTISIEDGERLIALTEEQRKTLEMTVVMTGISDTNKRLKEAGL